MNKVKLLLFISCASLLLSAGCAKQQQFKAVEQICVANIKKPEAMQITEDVLRRMHFTISKADAEQGLIRTKPLPGAQFFEFWRSDNVGALNSVEANLHSLRRTVELDITQQGGQLCIGCDVKVQRLSLPEHKVGSSSRQKGMAWLNMGEDTTLSTKILKRIEKKLKVKTQYTVRDTR
jgi:hypothetical protein